MKSTKSEECKQGLHDDCAGRIERGFDDPNSNPVVTAIMLWGMENGYAYKWT